MRESMSPMLSALLLRGTGACLVVGLALFCGRFVEEAAQKRHAARMASLVPQQITQLSAAAVSRDAAQGLTQPAMAATCTPVLTLTPKEGAVIALTLDAPCAAETPVEITHAGMVLAARMPTGRPLHMVLPALSADGAVSARLPDGTTVSAAVPVADLGRYRRFAVTWSGPADVALHGIGPSDVSAEAPGPGPASGQGWMASLGDADLAHPRLAQVFTYPAEGTAEPMLELASTPATCGQSLIGQTISSRFGQADATGLRVDLPDCAAGRVVMHLKNLDQEMKVASR